MKKTSTTLQSRTQDDVLDYQITKNSRIIDYGMTMTQEVPQKAPHSNNGRISTAFVLTCQRPSIIQCSTLITFSWKINLDLRSKLSFYLLFQSK